jgi:dTDP-4-dehydrorhamnose 3,5-epimerase
VSFTIEPLAGLPEVRVITPPAFPDDRGVFYESWHAEKLARLGFEETFVQDNHSASVGGVLRGLHYQLPPAAQGKLVRAVVGEVFDVAVDVRRSSPSLGRWASRRLSATNREMLWIPPGFAHGFYVMGDGAVVVYKCTAPFSSEHDRSLLWSDPELGIDWPLSGGAPTVSEKDAHCPPLRAAELFP